MPFAGSLLPRVLAASETASAAVDMRGHHLQAVFCPTLDTTATTKLQGSYDGTTWFDAIDTTRTVLAFSTGTSAFMMDADYCARFTGANFIRVVISAAQAAAVTYQFIVARG